MANDKSDERAPHVHEYSQEVSKQPLPAGRIAITKRCSCGDEKIIKVRRKS